MFESATLARPMSRGFRCFLFGIAMTIFARLGPWSWPGWPAITALDFVLARAAPSVVGPITKSFGLVALMLVNSGFWALAAYAALLLEDRALPRR